MTHENIAAPLASALATKGYDGLTAVQEAVLAPETEERDLLVSAQTGSGKTVAFGLAMAPQLLESDAALTGAPRALAIAPTRELALQVARELGWLYAETGARIATCVGGMDFRTERRALERGAGIVVGTPGRLRDHIERGTLDLGGLTAAVLDEADEMLDLGFREDLEFILEAAPDTRRTLLFSATVPPAIERLAGTFQKEALRIVAKGEARQHVDIDYRALTVAPRDKEPAIFNLLRLHDAQTAIIFCKTRANVSHLLARLGNRGFNPVALSGELSQQERSHALQALRDGRARVCVATDVAARGIDLPGLELVIHADLPTNSETLLHRSGRTGRAGAKGISALIVAPSEQKKAQRLLKFARVTATWEEAPSAEDVRARDDERMLAHPSLTEPLGDETELAETLLAQFGAEQIAGAFVRLWRAARPAPEDIAAPTAYAPKERRDHDAFNDSVWFSLSAGHAERAEPRWLLPKICDAGGITRDAIGAIRVRDNETFVQITAEAAPAFGDESTLGEGLSFRRLAEAPNLERPQRRGPPTGKPRGPRPSGPKHNGAKPFGQKPQGPKPSGPKHAGSKSTDAKHAGPKNGAPHQNSAKPGKAKRVWTDPKPEAGARDDKERSKKPRWSKDKHKDGPAKPHRKGPQKGARPAPRPAHGKGGAARPKRPRKPS